MAAQPGGASAGQTALDLLGRRVGGEARTAREDPPRENPLGGSLLFFSHSVWHLQYPFSQALDAGRGGSVSTTIDLRLAAAPDLIANGLGLLHTKSCDPRDTNNMNIAPSITLPHAAVQPTRQPPTAPQTTPPTTTPQQPTASTVIPGPDSASVKARWRSRLGPAMPELLLLSGTTPVVRAPLHGQSVTVGRSPANDISLPDDELPPFLCSFEPLGAGRYRVVDRSGRGVVVNGKTVHNEEVKDGAVFAFGRLQGRFTRGADEREANPKAGQRTGVLRTRTDGTLLRSDVRLRLPSSLGGKRLEIPSDGLRVGALPDNDIVVDDGFTSSFHAQLFLRGERLFVRDLDSTNGTFIGNVRVVEAEVPVGAVLRFGKAEVHVESDDAEVVVDVAAGKGPWRCAELHTNDPGFAKTFALIEKVAPHDASVCVFGETGTGKELAAHALHTLSGRRNGPFVGLNCAAFPEELIESELFGHEKGAFTGADRQRKGCFEEADKGSLFLDEIGELPLEMQAKLLRVLETRAVRRLGGRGDIPIDVRIVCATHRDLVKHVREGRFREDLLHRIYVIPVKLPALRERTADVLHLARLFAEKLAPNGKVKLTSAAEQALMAHPFPGNVRELRNVIQRALILGDGKTITDDDVAFIPVSLAEVQDQGALYKKGMTMDDVEKAAIENALQAFGSLGEAAKSLGVAKTTFWRKAKQFGFTKEDKPDGP